MTYPVRVINNKIKMRHLPALIWELGEYKEVPTSSKKPTLLDIFFLLTLMSFMIGVMLAGVLLVAMPISDIVSRERTLAQEIRGINSDRPEVTLTRLLSQHEITIQHRANFGDTQAVITIASEPPLSLMLYITSQVPGVFSLQYSQDGFQIFIAGGSI